MPRDIPFYQQETRYSCAPACLRMVMESLGVIATEAEIRERCECDEEGTAFKKIAAGASTYGFQESWALSLGIDEDAGFTKLQELLRNGANPIVYLRILPFPHYPHAVVVCKLTTDAVEVLDPHYGQRQIKLPRFLADWTDTRQVTVFIG